jgi:hypothetical protein
MPSSLSVSGPVHVRLVYSLGKATEAAENLFLVTGLELRSLGLPARNFITVPGELT